MIQDTGIDQSKVLQADKEVRVARERSCFAYIMQHQISKGSDALDTLRQVPSFERLPAES
jgi:hypothetical protein